MKSFKIPLLARVVLAIFFGIVCGLFFPEWATRIFTTINSIFSNFLGFIIPLLILGLVAPGIADLGRTAGKLLLLTIGIAYSFTVFSGLFTYFTCDAILPSLLSSDGGNFVTSSASIFAPYFSIEIPPLMGVMTALIAAFTLGLGMSVIKGERIKGFMDEFRDIITLVIAKAIIPFLLLYIFGIFLSMSGSGGVGDVLVVFLKVIAVILGMTVILLLLQFGLAGIVSGRNPLKLLRTMFPAYMTALGTQSSAATIPITLAQTIKNGVRPDLAGFVVPLCATIHLSGSTMKIVACSMAIMIINGLGFDFGLYLGFVMMLGITMIAAPGVPGGAIMASLGLLSTMLGFGEDLQGLMIALYIAMDSFGTACNVTGDGAIAVIIDTVKRKKDAVK